MPSSPIATLVAQLPGDPVLSPSPGELLEVFAAVPDPRNRRGIRHHFTGILVIAVCAVLAGARSFAAVAEWAADTAAAPLAGIGIKVPHASTIRRTLARVDADVFDTVLGAWVTARAAPKVIAVDGKEVRGAKNGSGSRVHLMAALDHRTGTVLGQVDVGVKTNEITMFASLLDTIKDLTAMVVTADAIHTQRSHAHYLHERGGHYVLSVKGNQKHLHRQLRTLPWAEAPEGNRQQDRGHGRISIRRIKVVGIEAGILFPHAVQAAQITRRTRKLTSAKWRTETVYAITSLPTHQASPAQLNTWIRGHWGIENRLHWTRDVTYAEDHSQVRSGIGPRMMASLRNTAISLYRLANTDNIAEATRHTARDPHRALKIAGIKTS